MGLLSLPNELLIKIFLYLDISDAFNVQAIHYSVPTLYQHSPELQYDLDCQIAGVDNNPRCRLPIQTRIQMLRDRQSSWKCLEPTSREEFKTPIQPPGHYDISRSHLILGTLSRSSPIWKADGAQSLALLKETEERWSTVFVENLVDFSCCIDEHDLFICVSNASNQWPYIDIRVHLFQHSTGQPHPQAAKPVIFVCAQNAPDLEAGRDVLVSIEACGENLVLAVNVSPSDIRLFVFNWKSGNRKSEPISLPNLGLVTLRHDIVLNPNLQDHCLDIYRIPPSSDEGATKRISRLCLPSLVDGADAVGVDCCAAPNPTGGGEFPRHIPSTSPFVNRPENAIIIFTWEFSYKSFTFPFSMIVHRQSIIGLLPAESQWSADQCHTCDWNDWGPPKCHWVLQPRPHYITVTNGQRYVKYDKPGGFGPGSFTILDFNEHTIKRAQATRNPDACSASELVHPIFAETLSCNLPYLQIKVQVDDDYAGVMINDNAIVGTHEQESSIHVLRFG